ncbi:MAG: RNA-binding protein [Clostridiales bacterium]|nr:RNA-binding protein [Clostridiales bacterium]
MKPEIRSGIAVISKKGRDKGRLFMVLYELDADFVMICDGDLRKLERPKKKRRKHLSPTSLELQELTALYNSGRLKNSDVRAVLAPFNETLTLSQDAPK